MASAMLSQPAVRPCAATACSEVSRFQAATTPSGEHRAASHLERLAGEAAPDRADLNGGRQESGEDEPGPDHLGRRSASARA